MDIGAFTKKFAQEAIGNPVKDVIDSLRPPDAAAKAESIGAPAQTQPVPGDNLAGVIMGQVQAMQNVLKEDQELIVLCTTGIETMRVLEIFAPAPRVLVLTGIDTERTVTRVISPADSLQLVCKPMPVQANAKPIRIRLVTPKPRPE